MRMSALARSTRSFGSTCASMRCWAAPSVMVRRSISGPEPALRAHPTCPRAPGTDLLFYLGRRTTFRRQGNVGERRVARGSMPMFLFRRNMHDIAWDNDLLLRFGGNDALARGHEQHLITTVSVHFVTRTRAEVYDAQIEVVARLRREQRLPRHRTTREQGSVHGLSWDLAGSVYLHSSILLSGHRAFLVSRGSVPASQCACNGASGHGHRRTRLALRHDTPFMMPTARAFSGACAGGALLHVTSITGSRHGKHHLGPFVHGHVDHAPVQGHRRGARGDSSGKDFAHPLVERHQIGGRRGGGGGRREPAPSP